MRLQLLDHTYPWWGKHAGFRLLGPSLAMQDCLATVTMPRNNIAARAIGKAFSTWNGFCRRDQKLAAAELEFLVKMRISGTKGHILYIEDHLTLLSRSGVAERWVGTINLPRRSWKPEQLALLRSARSAIVLCDRQRQEFSDLIPESRIQFVRYGVDSSFFRPKSESRGDQLPRLIFVGAWLRNTTMLSRLIPRVLDRFPKVVFDFVVPRFARKDPALQSLLGHHAIRWYEGLSDEALLGLYHNATAMLLPMQDSGANNAVVEALACGLPVITTDTGGIRSYGGADIFPVIPNNDDDACLDLVEQYLTQHDFRRNIGDACRRYAVDQLDWKQVAKEYITAYKFLGLV